MRSFFSFTIFFVLLSSSLFAKENKDLIKANYYYSHFAFHEAIPFFEKLATEGNDPVICAELGDCYRLTGNLQKSADWYGKAANNQRCKDAVILHYTQVLMQLTRYDEAGKWLKKYHESNKTDKRVINLIAACESAANKLNAIPSGIATFLDLNTEGSEFAPTLWKGNLVFTSDTVINIKKKTDNWTGNSYYNLYSVTCDAKGHCANDYNTVAAGNNLNIKYHDGPCTFSADAKEMYFTRSRYNNSFFSKKSVANKDSVVLLEIMIASDYDNAKKRFNDITPFEFNSKDYSVAHPSVSPNGNMLVFSSTMQGGAGGSDLYLCTRKRNKEWSKPVNAGKIINTEGEEVFPYWADDNTLYFSSDGHEGLGGLDIYKAKWDDKSHSFSVPENIGTPINSSYDDISLALYPDGRSSYFSSNRPASKGGDNIYFYKKEIVFLQLTVVDPLTQQPMPGVEISIDGINDKREKSSDNNGLFFTQLYPEIEYTVTISKGEYETQIIRINTTGTKETDTITRSIKLVKQPAPHRDTIAPVQQIVIRNKNVMDSPGIRIFELDETYEAGHFYYDYNKYDLKVIHKRLLDTLLTQLNRHPTMRIEIQAHTDCRGTDKSNQVLSNNRALSVVNYLVEHGISRKRLEYIGLGSSKPKVKCPICEQCTEDQHYLNRLLEFKVLHL